MFSDSTSAATASYSAQHPNAKGMYIVFFFDLGSCNKISYENRCEVS
jgi:hypothetical protein